MTTLAQWYPDPSGAPGLRYWDGTAWTDHYAPNPEPETPKPSRLQRFQSWATESAERNKFDAHAGPWRILSGKLTYKNRAIDPAGITWDVETGEQLKRITATRVVTIGVFALLAKKDTSQIYLGATLPDGEQILEGFPAKEGEQVRKFAAKARGLAARETHD